MTNKHAEMIDNIEKHGILARGQKELIAHLNDSKLTLRQAVYALQSEPKEAIHVRKAKGQSEKCEESGFNSVVV